MTCTNAKCEYEPTFRPTFQYYSNEAIQRWKVAIYVYTQVTEMLRCTPKQAFKWWKTKEKLQ